MLKPLSVQLYSLRERAEKDFYAVLKDVADMGYVGVEPAGFWNYTPAELKKVLDDLGLKIFSSFRQNPHRLRQNSRNQDTMPCQRYGL